MCENAHARTRARTHTHTMPFFLWIIAKKFEITALSRKCGKHISSSRDMSWGSDTASEKSSEEAPGKAFVSLVYRAGPGLRHGCRALF